MRQRQNNSKNTCLGVKIGKKMLQTNILWVAGIFSVWTRCLNSASAVRRMLMDLQRYALWYFHVPSQAAAALVANIVVVAPHLPLVAQVVRLLCLYLVAHVWWQPCGGFPGRWRHGRRLWKCHRRSRSREMPSGFARWQQHGSNKLARLRMEPMALPVVCVMPNVPGNKSIFCYYFLCR